MAKKITMLNAVERVWDIDGFPNYFFGHDKQLYRYDSQGRLKRNKRVVVCSTIGFVLKSRFFSLAQLRPMLRRHMATDRPTGF